MSPERPPAFSLPPEVVAPLLWLVVLPPQRSSSTPSPVLWISSNMPWKESASGPTKGSQSTELSKVLPTPSMVFAKPPMGPLGPRRLQNISAGSRDVLDASFMVFENASKIFVVTSIRSPCGAPSVAWKY